MHASLPSQCPCSQLKLPAAQQPIRASRSLRSSCRVLVQVVAQADRKSQLNAVVVGSGFAGLYAAAGLSRLFNEVTLLDKDDFGDALPGPDSSSEHRTERWQQQYEDAVQRRRSVSQYKQPHIMFKKGLELMEGLFPGYKQELSNAGALNIDQIGDIYFSNWGKEWQPGRAYGLPSLAASRHLYETVLRKFVLGVSNLQVRTNAAVKTLKYDADQQRVTGVELRNGQLLDADLIIDASGKASNITTWLKEIGHRTPAELSVNAGLKYAYRMYEMDEDPKREWLLAMSVDNPQGTRVGMMVPIETNKWQVNLCGYAGHHCPLDEEGFMEFARNLPSPVIHQALQHAKPVSSISSYSGTDNFRRQFEAAPPPNGLCVIGDAVCYFNPVNGQGMTVGMMGSNLLCQCIERQLKAVNGSDRQHQLAALDGLPADFHKQLGSLLDYPWNLAAGADAMKSGAKVQMPKQKSTYMTDLMGKYFLALQLAQFDDPYVMSKSLSVMHMVAPPDSLTKADVVLRVLWHQLLERLGASQYASPQITNT